MIAFAIVVLASAYGLSAIATLQDRRFNARFGTDDPKAWHRALCECYDGRERPVCEL